MIARVRRAILVVRSTFADCIDRTNNRHAPASYKSRSVALIVFIRNTFSLGLPDKTLVRR
jgi:hypothetical protein